MVHLRAQFGIAYHQLELSKLVGGHNSLAGSNYGLQRHLNLLLQRLVNHSFEVILSFDLFIEYSKRDIFQERQYVLYAVDHS